MHLRKPVWLPVPSPLSSTPPSIRFQHAAAGPATTAPSACRDLQHPLSLAGWPPATTWQHSFSSVGTACYVYLDACLYGVEGVPWGEPGEHRAFHQCRPAKTATG